jgi:hypothetical protein
LARPAPANPALYLRQVGGGHTDAFLHNTTKDRGGCHRGGTADSGWTEDRSPLSILSGSAAIRSSAVQTRNCRIRGLAHPKVLFPPRMPPIPTDEMRTGRLSEALRNPCPSAVRKQNCRIRGPAHPKVLFPPRITGQRHSHPLRDARLSGHPPRKQRRTECAGEVLPQKTRKPHKEIPISTDLGLVGVGFGGRHRARFELRPPVCAEFRSDLEEHVKSAAGTGLPVSKLVDTIALSKAESPTSHSMCNAGRSSL